MMTKAMLLTTKGDVGSSFQKTLRSPNEYFLERGTKDEIRILWITHALESASKIRISSFSFVPPSKIFVWAA
jgi:hypothetical protein